jgi:deoxyribodipyrimidine photo-lyase
LYWFRSDLRLADNPALSAAIAAGEPIVPFFVLDDADAGTWACGGASRWWLHGSLERLSQDLGRRGSRLVLRRGPAEAAIDSLVGETGASAVFWNRRYEPWATTRDAQIKEALTRRGLRVRSRNGALLCEPWDISTAQGSPYRVFGPFYRALQKDSGGSSAGRTEAPHVIPAPQAFPASDELASWHLRPTRPDWAGGLRRLWRPGEDGALDRLRQFLDGPLEAYHQRRDAPGEEGTSRLSPHLHFGEISPHRILDAVRTRSLELTGNPVTAFADAFLKEIGWREFSYHLLFHFPDLPTRPLRAEFDRFPWAEDQEQLAAWKRGMTGYPIVDAGMRELWATGWMHNRVRMVVASFLVKDLLQSWRPGEDWFWDTLVDADLANNAASWQWVSGCGADAAPFFRIFNPVLQGEKFDPDGRYIRRWIPELAKLPDKLIHAPWKGRPIDLSEAGVVLGKTYPLPLVDHGDSRARALAAFRQISGARDRR